MNWLDRLERKMGRFYIAHLMKYLCLGMLGVFILDYLPLLRSASALLRFDRALILRGQVWRLLTFVFLPPTGSLIWILFSLYFYYFLGTSLESRWGSRRFNLYYLIGVLGSILCGFITGSAGSGYLNMTLMLAFAVLFPDMEFMLFFFLPVKARWLGWFWTAMLIWQFLNDSPAGKLGLLFALLPFFLFFGRDCLSQGRLLLRRARYWITTHWGK